MIYHHQFSAVLFSAGLVGFSVCAMAQDMGLTEFRELQSFSVDKVSVLLHESSRCRDAGNITEAMRDAERAVAAIDGATTIHLSAVALTTLSGLKQDRGKLSEAESLSRQALKLLSERMRDRNIDYAIAAGNLADVLTVEGRYIEATRLLDEAQQIYQKREQTRSKHYADFLAVKAELALAQDHSREAIHALTQEWEIRQEVRASAEEFGRLYQSLAVAYEKAGRLGKALELLNKDRRIWSDLLPDDHPDKVTSLATLLVLRTRLRHYSEANALVPFLLKHAESAFGSDTPALAMVLGNIGLLYERQKRHEEAASLLLRCYQINQHTLGPFHPTTAYLLKSYGRTLTELGRKEEGQALEIQANAVLGLVH